MRCCPECIINNAAGQQLLHRQVSDDLIDMLTAIAVHAALGYPETAGIGQHGGFHAQLGAIGKRGDDSRIH